MFLNYNQYLVDYFYYLNFQNFYDYIEKEKNEFLDNFYKSKIFEEQTKIIMNLLTSKKNRNIELKKGFLEKISDFSSQGKILKLNDNFFLNYSYDSKAVEIDKFNSDKSEIYYLPKTKINCKKIYSLTCSPKTNKIYACLLNFFIVKIFQYNLKDKTMILLNEKIKKRRKGETNHHFFKCIKLANGDLATSSEENIKIWYKKYHNSKYYDCRGSIYIFGMPKDLLSIDNKYFISSNSQVKTISFYNIINNYKNEKTIPEIDSIDSPNCLFLYKKYIIVNCKNGFALLSIKTKELIQYRCNFKGYTNKNICIGNDESIYIINIDNRNISIKKLAIEEGLFKTIKEYKQIEIDKLGYFVYSQKEIICFNDSNIIIWKENIYILKEKIDNTYKLCNGEEKEDDNDENEELIKIDRDSDEDDSF